MWEERDGERRYFSPQLPWIQLHCWWLYLEVFVEHKLDRLNAGAFNEFPLHLDNRGRFTSTSRDKHGGLRVDVEMGGVEQ